MKNHWHIILNPQAGNGQVQKNKAKIFQAFKDASLPFEMVESKYPGHAESLAKEAIAVGYRNILSVGGDGTNNEIVNGIFKQKKVEPLEIQFASLPFGTGNDWARASGISKIPKKLIACIEQKTHQIQDVGIAKYYLEGKEQLQYFINVAGLAFDAYVVKSLVGKRSRYLNKSIYLIAILKSLQKYQGIELDIKVDGKAFYSGKVYTVNAGICRYSGGGLQITPHAINNDGLLALTVIDFIPRWKILLSFQKLLMGTILSHPSVSYNQCKEIVVQARNENFGIELDGEYTGEGPVLLSIIPKALKFIGP